MSIYDDTIDGSGVLVYAGHWVAAEPNSARWVTWPLMGAQGATFYQCAACRGYCDGVGIVTGDFGSLHCTFCGSDRVHTCED